jgi:hypothetical protein
MVLELNMEKLLNLGKKLKKLLQLLIIAEDLFLKLKFMLEEEEKDI